MPTLQLSARRLILAGGFAVALAASPVIAAVAVPSASPLAQCASGEEPDPFVGTCIPHTVPNSGGQFTNVAGNPSLPAVEEPGGGGSIPCTGANSGQCIGLAEEGAAAGPAPTPESSVSADTNTGAS